MKLKPTVPYPANLGCEAAQNNYPRLYELGDVHTTGKALIEKLSELKYADKDICLKEWLAFTEAFEKFFNVENNQS